MADIVECAGDCLAGERFALGDFLDMLWGILDCLAGERLMLDNLLGDLLGSLLGDLLAMVCLAGERLTFGVCFVSLLIV
jgi:hypothetical protein